MRAAIPGIAPTNVAVMNIDPVHATLRPHLARRAMPIAPAKPKIAAPIDQPAQAPSTSLDRPSAEGSLKNEASNMAHPTQTTAPISSATLTQRGVAFTRASRPCC